jgi:calcium-translocating P-type ATPase
MAPLPGARDATGWDDVPVTTATRSDAFALEIGDVADELGVDLERGLDSAEAARRLTVDGPNALSRPRRPRYLRIAASQVVDPLVALLVAAAVVSAAIGEGLEAVVIGAIVLLNAVLGFLLEAGAEREVLALHASLELEASVVRDGAERIVPAVELVPGDVLVVREGDRVPADGRVAHTHGLEVDESLLTGESLPVEKSADPVAPATPLAERAPMLYAGTGVTRGSGTAVVVATGTGTEQGTIARLVELASPPPTPLQLRLGLLARALVAAGAVITLGLAAAMLARGESLHEAFLVGVSVAVAAVPEGLAAILTIALALGSRAMARRRAIVRTLGAIETVGEATVICADKTGTLTENRMRLDRVVGVGGADSRSVLAAAALSSVADVDPVDRALVRAAAEQGVVATGHVVRSLPFEAARKRATVVVSGDDGLTVVVKGAPEVVLERCREGSERIRLAERAEEWAAEGIRVLAIARRAVGRRDEPDLERELEPVGLVGLADPLRPTAAQSVADARRLGLDVQMLTGDHPLTAASIGRRLGLPPDHVHARFTPADKLALVEQLQARGDVVAVTGDGVNDAPALRQADVGIAMGGAGTEAAREASTLVLTDDDFASIVAAVEEGRRVAANVRSFLAFLLSANVGEVVLFAIAIVAGLGVPMTVVQVLVVNLVTDGPPAVALAADRATAGREWLRRGAPLLSRRLVGGLLGIGGLIGACSLAVFLVVRETRPEAAQTAAFATVALAELVLVFSCRSELLPSWRLQSNRLLWMAVAGSLALVVAAVYVPGLHEPLGTVALDAAELALVVAFAVAPAVAAELAKWLARSRARARLTS